MLQKVMQDLRGDDIVARDGNIGSVKDVYFDDERWAVRYLEVDTGRWLPGRRVLISPVSVSSVGADEINVDLTRQQVEQAPGPEHDPPVSRLYEQAHARYYGYPYYWTGPYLWGAGAMPIGAPSAAHAPKSPAEHEEVREQAVSRAEESHLRSSSEVAGYLIRAADGDIGHVEDFLVDSESWAIADMVVDTRNWLPGRKVLVPPSVIEAVDWANKEVSVRLTREELRQAPEAP
jgi:sporulation protein YlmC with PRC-barrel domain